MPFSAKKAFFYLIQYHRIYSFNAILKTETKINYNLTELFMSRVDEIKNLVDDATSEMEKFYDKGNKAAGTRARKNLQELKKLAQEIRLEIQDMKNNG